MAETRVFAGIVERGFVVYGVCYVAVVGAVVVFVDNDDDDEFVGVAVVVIVCCCCRRCYHHLLECVSHSFDSSPAV